MAAGKSADLLSKIDDGAHDNSSDLPTLLRKCIALGGVTGSDRLRDWASLELKGYGADDTLPSYRIVNAPILLDGISGNNQINGQTVPAAMIPAFARDQVGSEVPFPQPIAEIADLLESARKRGDEAVRLGVPGGPELVALINNDLKQAQVRRTGWSFPQMQTVDRIYCAVNPSPIARILDVVRTTLVELIAEMRAAMPSGQDVPSHEVTEQAVDIAIYGKKNRVIVNQTGANSEIVAAAGGSASIGEGEKRSRTVLAWIAAIAAIAAAAVWALFLR